MLVIFSQRINNQTCSPDGSTNEKCALSHQSLERPFVVSPVSIHRVAFDTAAARIS
jgi:hypothetical protein